MLEAVSLVRQGDWELSDHVACYAGSAYSPDGGLPYFLVRTPDGVYSIYPSGMVVFAAPVAALARCVGGDLDSFQVRARLEKWTACWVACACLALFFLLALHRVGPAPALAVTALLATGSVFYSTVGQALWQHGGVILWALAALLLEHRQARRERVALTLLQGAACALMLACRLSSALFVVPFGAWVLLRSPRRALLLAVAAAVAYAPWAWAYASTYGTPFGPSMGQLAGTNFTPHPFRSLLGVLASPSHGLLVYQPWLLLGCAALLPAVRRRAGERSPCPAGLSAFCVVVVALHLALVSSWNCWWGGACWGSRLASETVPLLALLLLRPVASLWRTAVGRWVLLGVGLLAFLVHLPGTHLRAFPLNPSPQDEVACAQLWSWAESPFLQPFRRRAP
jgi:hypothetical protein